MIPREKSQYALLLLAAALLSLFWPALLHPFYVLHPTFSPFSDTMVIHWPKAHLMAQSWLAGQGLPHWTPLILSGMPLAANQLAMLFYPPAWLFLLLPIEPVFNLLFIFHLLLGSFGVYFLLHKAHGLSPRAALLAGLTFGLNGKWLAHAAGGHVSMVGAAGWMPWALFGLMMLLRQRHHGEAARVTLTGAGRGAETAERFTLGRSVFMVSEMGWAILVAVALAMQIVTHTLLLIYTVYLVAAAVGWYLIFVQTSSRLTRVKGLLLPLLAIPILAGLLGAVQLLPLAELVRFSNRSLSLSEAAEFAVTPAQLLVGLLLPSAQGGHELVIYMGLIPLLLAPFGLSRKNRWSWFYGLLLIFAVLFALGPSTPVHSLFYYVVPGFGWVRTPARMFFVGALAIAALTGFGVERLAQGPWSPRASRWLTRLAVALGGLALLTSLGLAFGFSQMNRATLALAIFIPVGLALIVLQARHTLSTTAATGLLGISLFLDLASFDASLMHFVSLDEALRPGRLPAEYLAEKLLSGQILESGQTAGQAAALFRVYSPSYSLPMATAAAAGLQLADGVEPVHLAIYDQYMARAGGYHDASFSVTIPPFGNEPLESALRQTQPNLKLLGLLNVVYLAAAFPMDWPGLTLERETGGTFIYRNEQALPRAWVAYQAIPAEADWLAQLENLPDLREVVITDRQQARAQQEGAAEPPAGQSSKGSEAVNLISYSADLIEVETEIADAGWLVLSEIWYPGWQATVNGSPQPVEKVNGLLRGVYLSQAGRYQIQLAYQPASVIWGSWLSGITVGLLVLAGLFGLSKRRWPAGVKPRPGSTVNCRRPLRQLTGY